MNKQDGVGVVLINKDGSREKVSLDDPRLENVDWTLPEISDEEFKRVSDKAIFEVLFKIGGEEYALKAFDGVSPIAGSALLNK